MTLSALACRLGLHSWDASDVKKMQHRPCYRYKTCLNCEKEKHYEGYHRFQDWSKTYYVKVYYGEEYVGTESKQNRYCNDCQIYDERTLQ